MLGELQPKLDRAIEVFRSDLATLRTGRASTGLVENLMVDSNYGSKMPIKQLANINIPDSTTIAIQPWDKGNLGPIEKAIAQSSLGLAPMNDGQTVRVSIPPLSSERREELVKVASEKAESARVSVRNLRREAMDKVEQQVSDKTIGEDEQKRLEKQVQDKIDEYNRQIDKILGEKEQEIKTV